MAATFKAFGLSGDVYLNLTSLRPHFLSVTKSLLRTDYQSFMFVHLFPLNRTLTKQCIYHFRSWDRHKEVSSAELLSHGVLVIQDPRLLPVVHEMTF